MSPDRVGPFALRALIAEDSDTGERGAGERDAGERGDQLWLAERVAGERSPRFAAVRRAADPGDRALSARIEAEYAALKAVADPRIPTVLGHFAGQAALATTWAPGPTLAEVLDAHRRGALTLDAATVVDLVLELAEALRHVHARQDARGRPLVHGHLEAHRVRLGPDGAVVLLGLGRPRRPRGVACLPPESLAGAEPTPAWDQWALGALLLELLTGGPLYAGPDGRPADPATRREGAVEPWLAPIAQVNPAMGRLLARLLAVDPAGRFADEGELLRTLGAVRRALPGVADRSGLAERLVELGQAGPQPPAPAPGPPPPAQTTGPSPVPQDVASPVPPVSPEPSPEPDGDFDDRTEPLDLLASDLPARPKVPYPAGRGRLGLGEWAALGAMLLLVFAILAAVLVRA